MRMFDIVLPPTESCFSSPVALSTFTRVIICGALHQRIQPHSPERQPGSGLSCLNILKQGTEISMSVQPREAAWLRLILLKHPEARNRDIHECTANRGSQAQAYPA